MKYSHLISASAAALALLLGCSKKNDVNAVGNSNTFVGQECFGWDAGECGDNLVCVAGFCRDACTSDADCNGGICVSDGLVSGCRLPEEGSCSNTNACPDGLQCGLDHACRTECGAARPCPSADQKCIASTCVGKNEPGASQTWFSCTPGDKRCNDQVVQGCDLTAAGWADLNTCYAPMQCVDGACTQPVDAGTDVLDAPADSPLQEAGLDAGPDGEPEPEPEAGPDADASADAPPEASQCLPPNQMCGTTCTNTASDPLNCTYCDNVCPVPDHSKATCSLGSCGYQCLSGFDSCDGDSTNGCETSITDNDLDCGQCGHSCAIDHVCQGTSCVQDPGMALQFSAGDRFTCAAVFDGRVLCWGANDLGQLGSTSALNQAAPTAVPGVADAVQVSAGLGTACARLSGGSVSCWGANGEGQTGASSSSTSTATLVQGIQNAVDITVSNGPSHTHACAAMQGGAVWCWGSNASGELGASTPSSSYLPLPVPNISTAVEVAAGSGHSCARLSSGQVWCWGAGTAGQLGNGGTTASATPVQVNGIADAAQIAAAGARTCARRTGGTVVCWGDLSIAGLGTAASPVALSTVAQAADVTVGPSTICAARTDGSVTCLGTNANGEVGDATTTARTSMTAVKWGGTNATIMAIASASAGTNHTCLLGSDSSVMCTGDDTTGELGDAQLLPGGNRYHAWPAAGFRQARGEFSACVDHVDNDRDSFTDGDDSDCATSLGSTTGSPVGTFTVNAALANHFMGSCGGSGREKVYRWSAPSAGTFELSTAGSSADTVLYVRDGATDGVELACNNDIGGGYTTSKVQIALTGGQTVIVFVDTAALSSSGSAALGIKKL